jgi:hypothetical protein
VLRRDGKHVLMASFSLGLPRNQGPGHCRDLASDSQSKCVYEVEERAGGIH